MIKNNENKKKSLKLNIDKSKIKKSTILVKEKLLKILLFVLIFPL